MSVWRTGLAALVLSSAPVAAQVTDGFERAADNDTTLDFSGYQADLAGGPTQVLVLGTPHLAQLPDTYPLALISGLLDRLEAYAPDVITIEAMRGADCYLVRDYGEVYPGIADGYCPDPAIALNAIGMTQPEAARALIEALTTFPDTPAPADRRRLAGLLYASGDPHSATMQWMQLDEAERITADGIDDALAERLDRRMGSRNENIVIGAEIGSRLGHVRIYPSDDHTADRIYALSPDTLGPAVRNVWRTDVGGMNARREALEPLITSPDGVLEYYRRINAADYQRGTIDTDFGQAATSTESDHVARRYLAWWQVRGLRMAANVMEAAAQDPGGRVLVIVGSSHKAYMEAYLDQMHDVELVSLDAVLAADQPATTSR